MMYNEFFNLKSKPFELLPNPEFLFPSSGHRKVLNYLSYGIHEKTGFILLTGEVGCGKTTLIRNIIRGLGRESIISLVFNTRVNGEQLIALVNEDFGLEVKGKGKVELLGDLNNFLVSQAHKGVSPILIVDEAQNLSAEALEEIRMLSNLEAETFKLIQIILVGQPELKAIIAHPSLSQLRQRIGISCHIDALGREETEAYVYHRLETAGNRDALKWCEGSFDALYSYSKGVPRRINLFCDFLLLAAFADGTKTLTMEMIRDVVGDVGWGEPASEDCVTPVRATTSGAELDILRQLTRLEEKLDQLAVKEAPLGGTEKRFASHETILNRIVERQETDLRKVKQGLVRIEEMIESMQKRFVEPTKVPEAASAQPSARKGVLARIFG